MPPKIKDPDPLSMDALDPEAIQMSIDAKKMKPPKPMTEMDMKKEERLAMKEARLAGKAPEAGPSAAPAADAPLTASEKTKLLDKLSAYKERFPHLKTRNKTLKTAEDIIDELHYTEMQLGQAKGGLTTTLFYGAMSGVEYVTTQVYNPLELNLEGLGEVTKKNMSEFEPILDELAIKYGASGYMAPEVRLAIAVGATILTVHAANSGDPAVGRAINKMNAGVQRPAGSDSL